MRQAKDLKAGDVIKVEYGDYGNWVRFAVDEVHRFEKMVTVKCHSGEIPQDFSYRPEEEVETDE